MTHGKGAPIRDAKRKHPDGRGDTFSEAYACSRVGCDFTHRVVKAVACGKRLSMTKPCR